MAAHARSWVPSANRPGCGFPLQNLPYCAFVAEGGEVHLGVGIGERVLDLERMSRGRHLGTLSGPVQAACRQRSWNAFMQLGPAIWPELRMALTHALCADAPKQVQAGLSPLLMPVEGLIFAAPVEVPNYTDFYASIEHATNVGRLFRPDQPLLPAYKFVPMAYHGRASSLLPSGHAILRPCGQVKMTSDAAPVYRPTSQLDYEVEVAAYIGQGNALGEPIRTPDSERHIFGFSLMNDWSARDIQAWEYQPLGPFLGKSFATTLAPWIVAKEALAPFRVARATRPHGDPEPLPYLDEGPSRDASAIDITLEVYLSTAAMRSSSSDPALLSQGNLRDLYWSFAQMVAHHTANGCNLTVGDLLGSGTVSGATSGSEGSLLEITRHGQTPIGLANGESRTFLEDGDEIILRGFCEREGVPRISLGECRGTVSPARVPC